MRILDCRRLVAGLTICTALAFGGKASAQGSTQVETFMGTGVVNCTLPGSTAGGGVTFSSNATLQTVDFAPGSVNYMGQPVDFDGREAQFLSNTYGANVHSPVASGPATVTVSGTGSIGGSGGGGGGGCMVVGGNVPLGPTFSPNKLDITAGPGPNLKTTVPSWNSTAVPQLNGHIVTTDGPLTVTSVDAVNGIVNFNLSGKIFAGNEVVPALTTLGSICLAIGLFGLALLALSRRTARGSASRA